MSFDPREFTPPEMWTTYSEIEQPARELLLETDRTTKDGPRLDAFAAKVMDHGLHGDWAAGALTWCSLDVLAGVMGVQSAATTVSLVSRVVPWRDQAGVTINAMLSAVGSGGHADAMRWADNVIRGAGPEVLARGLGQRLVFAIETAGLLSRRTSEQVAAQFLDDFFTPVR